MMRKNSHVIFQIIFFAAALMLTSLRFAVAEGGNPVANQTAAPDGASSDTTQSVDDLLDDLYEIVEQVSDKEMDRQLEESAKLWSQIPANNETASEGGVAGGVLLLLYLGIGLVLVGIICILIKLKKNQKFRM